MKKFILRVEVRWTSRNIFFAKDVAPRWASNQKMTVLLFETAYIPILIFLLIFPHQFLGSSYFEQIDENEYMYISLFCIIKSIMLLTKFWLCKTSVNHCCNQHVIIEVKVIDFSRLRRRNWCVGLGERGRKNRRLISLFEKDGTYDS